MKRTLLALAFLATPAFAQTTLTLPPVGADAWIIPSDHTPTLYGETDPTDNYGVSQWGNPVSDLGNFAPVSCTGTFAAFTNCIQATSPNIIATTYTGTDSNRWIDFQTTGVGVTCGQEMDSLHTALSSFYAGYPQAVTGNNANLGLINHLYIAFKGEPVAFSTIDSDCGTIGDGMILEAGFTNVTAGQTLFYQLNLYKWPSPAGAAFFSNTNPFGYRDVMANYSLSPLTVGIIADFTGGSALDILARVKAIIAGASNGMDTNVNNWAATGGSYHGHNTFGHTTAETAFCCLTMMATSGPVPRPVLR